MKVKQTENSFLVSLFSLYTTEDYNIASIRFLEISCTQMTFAGKVVTTLCLKKVPTIKLSVTFVKSELIFKLFHCWKAYEIFYKTRMTIPTSP